MLYKEYDEWYENRTGDIKARDRYSTWYYDGPGSDPSVRSRFQELFGAENEKRVEKGAREGLMLYKKYSEWYENRTDDIKARDRYSTWYYDGPGNDPYVRTRFQK